MKCNICGFDMEPLPGEPMGTHCEGCGVRIAGGDKPFPGFTIDPDGHPEHDRTDPVIVDDELREQFPHKDLADVLIVRKATFHWGRGIGSEPDGHIVDKRITVEKTSDCPTCGHDEIRVRYSQNRAGIAGSVTETCTRCEKARSEDRWY